MAVLEKIRVRLGVFITVIIGVALISFIVDVDTLRSVMSMFSSKYDVGKMNGKSISYTDFQKKVDYYTSIQQLRTGGSSLSESQQEEVRNIAWNDYFKEDVLNPEFKKSGIDISAEEMVDMAQGRSISPVLMQDPVFSDETGQFNRNAVLSFIQSINNDPSGQRGTYWRFCENQMRDVQLIEKYTSLLSQSQYINSLQMKRALADQNTTVSIEYVVQPLGFLVDSTITVSESELKAYYKKNEKNYEQESARDIEYVSFLISPSDEDIALAEESINKAYEEFEKTEVDGLRVFVSRNSDKPFDEFYYKQGELLPALDSFAFSKEPIILPVFKEENTFYAARVVSEKMLPDSVHVRYMAIQGPNEEQTTKLADSLINVLNNNTADFEILAQQYSADIRTGSMGGDLGWITQGFLPKELEMPVFEASPNSVQKIELDNVAHIVEVTERSAPLKKVQLAVIQREALPGKLTTQSVFAEANALATESKDAATFTNMVNEKLLMKIPAYGIREGDRSFAGFQNAREIVRWAYEAKPNTVSAVMNVDNDYFVVAVLVTVREEGIAPFAYVRSNIETLLRREKQAEKMAQQLKDAMAGTSSIEQLGEKLGLTPQTAFDISFSSNIIPGIGYDFKLLGATASATPQTITGPVKGSNGVYVFSVIDRQVGGAYTAEDEKMRQRLVLMQGGEIYDFVRVFQKSADMKDWRGRFF